MRDQGIWSIRLGRWNGLQVRLHMFFFVFAAFTIYLSWLDASSLASEGTTWLGMAGLLILLFSVAAHECGHVLVANRLGASVHELILGPLGGLGPPPGPLEPQGELLVTLAGPLVNLGLCGFSVFCLAVYGGVDIAGLLHPLAPHDILSGPPLLVGLKLTLWINGLLLLINLIPAFPFDGGRAVRSSLMLLHPGMEPQRAVSATARLAKITAVALAVCALVSVGSTSGSPVPTWFALMMLAILVYFSAKKEEAMSLQGTSDEALFGYDFSAGYTSLEQSGPKCSTKPAAGPIVRWWKRRKELREQRRRELEALEDGRVDGILERVHESGLDSLSTEDRELLQRVSARYRSRVR